MTDEQFDYSLRVVRLAIGVRVTLVFLLGVLSSLGLIIAILQYTQMKNQTALMRDQSSHMLTQIVAGHRAWVSPVEASFDGNPALGEPIKYLIRYGNTGREPALSFAAQQREGVVDNPGGRSWYTVFKETDVAPLCNDSGFARGAPTIYPSGLHDYSYRVLRSDKVVTAEILDGSKVLFVQGCFTYRTFGKYAESAWCFLLIPDIDPKTRSVTRYVSGRCPYGNNAT